MRKADALTLLLLLCGLLAVGTFLEGYALRVMNLALLNGLVVLGLMIVFGYVGIIHIGAAGFMGVGAYGTALLSAKLGLPVLLTIPLAVALSVIVAGLIARPLLRLSGHYMALATVGVNVVLELVAKNWVEVTGGYNGVSGIQRLTDWVPDMNPERAFLVLNAIVLASAMALTLRLRNSHIGRCMVAIRDDEIAARTAGVDVVKLKTLAFMIGAGYAGLAGTLFAHYTGFISPTDFGVPQSIIHLAMLIVGGESSVFGAVAGAILLTALPELLRGLESYYLAVFGLLTLLTLIFFPSGLAGLGRKLTGKKS